MYFASDNTGPVAPEIMAQLERANTGYAMPYGNDDAMARVRDLVRIVFEAPNAEVILVATGTAANSLSLATLTDPWQAVFCHEGAHLANDECNGPEFFTGGAKITTLPGKAGRIDPAALRSTLETVAAGGPQETKCGPLSVTQTTEAGTLYSIAQIRELTEIAKAFGQSCHMDGARFANAIASLGCTPAEMTWKSGIGILSLGGSKNGLMGVEAVVMFDPKHAYEFDLRRKRSGHVVSKNRFLAAQMEAYLTDDLWLILAAKANAAAKKLELGLREIPGAVMFEERQANMLFCGWPRGGHRSAQAAGASYYLGSLQSLDGPNDETLSARLVCNWATTDQDIQTFLDVVKG